MGISEGPAGVQRTGFQSAQHDLPRRLDPSQSEALVRPYCVLGAGDPAVNTAEPARAFLAQSDPDCGHPLPLPGSRFLLSGQGWTCDLQRHSLLSL